MKRMSLPLRLALAPALLSSALFLGACGDDSDNPTDDSKVTQELVVTFADKVVVPTYARLATRLTELDAACVSLAAAPTADKLAAAKAAWRAARIPWEQSEGFLFGPVDSFGYDPALDSWPVSHTELEAVLANNDALTQQYVSNLKNEQKGFHTLEYIIFGNGGTKTVGQLTAREFEYLKALSAELKAVGQILHGRWVQSVEGNAPFRDTLATAGQSGNSAYPSVQAAAQEMVGGITTILDEVANGKIAEPYDTREPDVVESQFAYNSLEDFTNNIRSVENAYLGHLPGETKTGSSLRDVVGVDSTLDVKIRQQIAGSISALAAIAEPFRESITNETERPKIVAAQEAIRTLHDTFQGEVLPLVTK
ncbi:peptidase M75 [Myxococcus sp. CA051A]|uniref:imelysin family protein n=1 Tax=unclassified Myxococcus TaxID=2648731 RepID=UPI00157B27AC|nr:MULTISPECIES: imelysin family protein [unclassified Myxococcus]NTX13317.1 peptidase M75 [Myxococcus sp. CA056]NTX61777.1 peptidase M75 [Myxococcus sp. CA051A]